MGGTDDGVVRLRRVAGAGDALLYIICTVIGSGIFISPKGVLEQAGKRNAALKRESCHPLVSQDRPERR